MKKRLKKSKLIEVSKPFKIPKGKISTFLYIRLWSLITNELVYLLIKRPIKKEIEKDLNES